MNYKIMHKLEKDLLKREEEVDFLITYLTNRYEQSKDKSFENKSFVLNINASWGSGKTYFLKSLSNQLKSQKFTVVEFDAWKNDYTKEPLLAFMSELNNSLESFFTPKQTKAKSFLKNIRKNTLPILLSMLSRKLTGYTIDELLNEQEHISIDENTKNDISNNVSSLTTKITEYVLQEHQDIKQSIEDFKINMGKLLNYIEGLRDKQLPLFILIDELDRCRPNYAIELLENIKHLFDVEGLYFIIATDSTQLAHSINAVYGNNFASEKYLKRFFDQEYKLKTPSNYEYIISLFNKYNLLENDILFSPLEEQYYNHENTKVKLFELFVELFDLKPRDINQVIISLHAVKISWNLKAKLHLPYLLFLIILKHADNNKYNDFLKNLYKTTNSYQMQLQDFLYEININHSNIKINTNRYNKDKGHTTGSYIATISLSEILEHYIKFYNMTYDKFNKNYHNTSMSIISNINKVVEEEIVSKNPENKIDISIFKYNNLVEHTGQLS